MTFPDYSFLYVLSAVEICPAAENSWDNKRMLVTLLLTLNWLKKREDMKGVKLEEIPHWICILGSFIIKWFWSKSLHMVPNAGPLLMHTFYSGCWGWVAGDATLSTPIWLRWCPALKSYVTAKILHPGGVDEITSLTPSTYFGCPASSQHLNGTL